jgi:hypothetical protein
MKEKLKIELKEYYHDCSDGCCTTYGTETFVNGEKMPFENQDAATILEQVLKHLGYDVEIEESYNGEVL